MLKMFAFNCITTVTAAGLECQYLHMLLKTFTCVQGPRTIREIWALVSAGWDLFIYPFSSLPSKCLRMSFSQRKFSISGTDLPASGCKGCIRQLHAELQLGLQIKSSTMHTCTVTVWDVKPQLYGLLFMYQQEEHSFITLDLLVTLSIL